MILVTGGCGFLGARFVLDWFAAGDEPLVNLDALTYAARPEALAALHANPRYTFVRGDIVDRPLVDALLTRHRPRAIVHLAAESHVDRSIADASPFERTNVFGTLVLLQAALAWVRQLPAADADAFRFLHCSSDEVFGSLAGDEEPCTEHAPYRPRNPYAASKAAADHFVGAFHATYGLPTMITRGSNTYGPGQYPEKLVALAIDRVLAGEPIPLYGDGLAVRDWLYVSDHASALRAVLESGKPGQSYNIAGHQAVTNVELAHRLLQAIDLEVGSDPGHDPAKWIQHVPDRAGHDRRYAMDDRKLRSETGWAPRTGLDEGLRATVRARLLDACTGRHGGK